jgi:hypothetical protein
LRKEDDLALFKIGSIGRSYRHMHRETGLQIVSRKGQDKIETLSRAVRLRSEKKVILKEQYMIQFQKDNIFLVARSLPF